MKFEVEGISIDTSKHRIIYEDQEVVKTEHTVENCMECIYYRHTFWYDYIYGCNYTNKPVFNINELWDNCERDHKYTTQKSYINSYDLLNTPPDKSGEGRLLIMDATRNHYESDGNNKTSNYRTIASYYYNINDEEETINVFEQAVKYTNHLNEKIGKQRKKCYG